MGEFMSFPHHLTAEQRYARAIDPQIDVGSAVRIASLSDHGDLVPSRRVALANYARQLLKARRTIAKVMPRNLFRDSAWDVMLELYIGAVEGEDVFVKQAIIASGECPATAMRIISRLDKSGFLARTGDANDQRRVIVTLTEKGCEAMELALEQMGGEFVN
jgi:hypothetical protein